MGPSGQINFFFVLLVASSVGLKYGVTVGSLDVSEEKKQDADVM